MRRSILTEKIARRGRHILREYSVDPLEFLQAGQLMTRDPTTLPGDMQIGDAVRFFAEEATHRSYPVVDKQGHLLGLVSRTDALEWAVNSQGRGQARGGLVRCLDRVCVRGNTVRRGRRHHGGNRHRPSAHRQPRGPARHRHHFAPGSAQGPITAESWGEATNDRLAVAPADHLLPNSFSTSERESFTQVGRPWLHCPERGVTSISRSSAFISATDRIRPARTEP